MILRDVTVEDLPHLLPLLKELGYPTTLESLEVRHERFLKNPGNGVVLCEKKILPHDSVQIVGFVAWSKSHLIISDITRFHIEALVVSSDHRCQGIAKMLLQYVEEIAQCFVPSLIDLTSAKRRAKEGTHDFYKRLGYSNDGSLEKVYLRKEFKNCF